MTAIMPIDEPRPRGPIMGEQVTGPRDRREELQRCLAFGGVPRRYCR
jgi:hypothetical protein